MFNTISQFIGYMVNLRLSFEHSRELLLFFCKKYEVDQSRTHLLLSELESTSQGMGYVFGKADIEAVKERRAEKIAGFSEYYTLGLCIKYVDGDSDLVKLLVLNKQSSQIIKQRVLKQALLLS